MWLLWNTKFVGYKTKETILDCIVLWIFAEGYQIIELYSRVERTEEKYKVFNEMRFEKSLHVLVINPRMDDDFFEIFYNAY